MAGDAPAVSVIVLTYNREAMLRRTLETVLGQTSTDIEVLVVDNESVDGTEDYVRSIADERVRYFRNANGGNLSVNRNFGIRQARGRWVAFVDDDDLWEPGKLAAQLAEAQAHPEAGVVCTEALFFSEDGGQERTYGLAIGLAEDTAISLDDLLHGRNLVVLSSSMTRRDVIDAVGPWEEDPAIFTIEDYQYWIRVAAAGYGIRFIARPLVRYRLHPGMVSHADWRITADKQLALIDGLHERGALDEESYRTARRRFERVRRLAHVKHFLKRVPGLKAAVYGSRRRAQQRRRD